MAKLTKLRDGSRVLDARLARIIDFDERSRSYPIRKLLKGRKPRSRTWRCAQVLDQGQEGACVGFACTHELIAYPCEVPNLGAKFAREKVYWEAQKEDEWPGGSYPGASPRYEGTSVLAGVKQLKKLGYIDEYRWAFSLSDLILALGWSGPVILGLEWRESMFDPHSCGYLHTDSEAAGGHCILAVGVNVAEGYVVLQNSWGARWGKQGRCKISFEELSELLAADGEACIPIGRHTKPRVR
jgi:hypothetical protein